MPTALLTDVESMDENTSEQVQEHPAAPPLTDFSEDEDEEEEIYQSADEEEDEEVECLIPDEPN